MTPDEYCQDKAARSGSSFTVSFLFLPPAQRRAITALYAFCREVDDTVDECREPMVARAKLQWWREELGQVYAGAPQHPVGRALQAALADFPLPREYFLEIIDGMEMDLEHSGYDNFSQLQLYCHRAAGVVGLMAAEIFGYEDRHTLKYAHELGIAFQLTNILRDVGEDAARGRIYLPRDELQQFGVSEAELGQGQMNENLRRLFVFQAERARRHYNNAFAKLPEVDRYRQRSGLIMAAVYLATLDRIEQEGYPVLTRRVHLGRWRKLWLAWRTARGEKRRHRRHLAGARG